MSLLRFHWKNVLVTRGAFWKQSSFCECYCRIQQHTLTWYILNHVLLSLVLKKGDSCGATLHCQPSLFFISIPHNNLHKVTNHFWDYCSSKLCTLLAWSDMESLKMWPILCSSLNKVKVWNVGYGTQLDTVNKAWRMFFLISRTLSLFSTSFFRSGFRLFGFVLMPNSRLYKLSIFISLVCAADGTNLLFSLGA